MRSHNTLFRTVKNFSKPFSLIIPEQAWGYSFKTNYLPAYCLEADRINLYAVVVSDLELQLALRLGVKPERIIFNGPYKTTDELKFALAAGVQVNIDSSDEFKRITKLRKENPDALFNIGIRCTLPLSNFNNSRFGIEVHSEELSHIIKRKGSKTGHAQNCEVCMPTSVHREKNLKTITNSQIK